MIYGFFREILVSQMGVKTDIRIIMQSYADDLEIVFPKNLILQPFGLTRPSRKCRSQNQTLRK